MEKGLFRKFHSLEILENLEILEILEILEFPRTVESKGESDPFLKILENLEILESLEIAPSEKSPFKAIWFKLEEAALHDYDLSFSRVEPSLR